MKNTLEYLFVFIICMAVLSYSIIPQKLQFYSLQNAVVESLVENHAWGMKGIAYSGNWFFQNLQTKTSQLAFIGDAYEYKGLWYPAKSYGAHYPAALIYAVIRLFGLTYSSHFEFVTSFLLISTSFILAGLGTTLTYMVAFSITKSRPKSIFVAICTLFGSLLSGGINIRNEETFGYWLYICVYVLTFFPRKRLFETVGLTILLWYSTFSLPIATLLLPLGLYRIFISSNKTHLKAILVTSFICIAVIALHNYLIFGRWVFSNYTIGEELNPGYRLGRFTFSWGNFVEKLRFYFIDQNTSVFTNYPLVIMAVIGIVISRQNWLTKIVTLTSVFGFAFYISNIGELTGYVGYGSGRYMLGIFPITYIYLTEIFRTFRPLLWLTTAIAAVVSIGNGMFFYFSPVRNIYDRGSDHFKYLPGQGNFFMIFAGITILCLFLIMLFILLHTYKQKGKHV